MEENVWFAVRAVREEVSSLLQETQRGSVTDTRHNRVFERSEFPERSLGSKLGTIGTALTNLDRYKPI